MSFILSKKLPTPAEIKQQYPVSDDVAALKARLDQELIDIIAHYSHIIGIAAIIIVVAIVAYLIYKGVKK